MDSLDLTAFLVATKVIKLEDLVVATEDITSKDNQEALRLIDEKVTLIKSRLNKVI